MSYELGLALSDNETEEFTIDVTLANEDGSADDGRPAGPVDPGFETCSPHGRSRGSSYSRETRAL